MLILRLTFWCSLIDGIHFNIWPNDARFAMVRSSFNISNHWSMKKLKTSTDQFILSSITCLLIILWVYAGLSKLIDFERSRGEMFSQPLAPWLEKILVWAVPLAELFTAALLLYTRTRLYGLVLSSLLLISFSFYISLVINSVFNRIPCSCGGVLKNMNWETHLAFNLCFLALALYATFHSVKERRNMGKDFWMLNIDFRYRINSKKRSKRRSRKPE